MAILSVTAAASAAQDDNPVRFALRNGDTYYPRDPVSLDASRRLARLLGSARREGPPVKVAMIAEPVDLGPLEEYFGHPQQYADRLYEESRDPETGEPPRAPMIIVMPAGFGTRNVRASARTAVRSVPVSVAASGDDLVQAAGLAVQRVLEVEGRGAPALFRPQATADGRAPSLLLLVTAVLSGAGIALGIGLRPRVRA